MPRSWAYLLRFRTGRLGSINAVLATLVRWSDVNSVINQCFAYLDFVDVAGVITNYSEANIPLETMWTDIDYMDRRRIFTVDPDYFPMDRMREIVEYLHDHDQQFS